MGLQNTELVLRGRKLVLNYTGGSFCGPEAEERRLAQRTEKFVREPSHNSAWDYDYDHYTGSKGSTRQDDSDDGFGDDDDNDKDGDRYHESKELPRKSTIISLLCERDPLASKPVISFVGASPDECAYFFEVRTSAACSVVEAEIQTLGPSGVFGVIFLVAFAVYVGGGCVYQRMVQNQRGWRQMPNYSLWAGIFSYFTDFISIFTSSCARILNGRRGYNRVSPYSNGRARGSASDDENRLIDQLDEEWDD
jgi:cation-dependent mannose-6-phosphate receptor